MLLRLAKRGGFMFRIRTNPAGSVGMNSNADKKNLTRLLTEIVGGDAVLADDRELVVYECDAYTLQKNLPTVVVLPLSLIHI